MMLNVILLLLKYFFELNQPKLVCCFSHHLLFKGKQQIVKFQFKRKTQNVNENNFEKFKNKIKKRSYKKKIDFFSLDQVKL